jgi:hypothetical protein
MVLLPLLNKDSCRCVAVLGTVKNAGKTETINKLIEEAAGAGLYIGITGSGRDGERLDGVFGNPKPAVRLPAGSLVLTYAGLAGEIAPPPLAPLQVLERHPCYGELLLARTRKEGEVIIAGPVTRRHMAAGLESLRQAGAGLILVDGSIDRKGFVDPGCIDAIILATGMALSPAIGEVAEKTAYQAEILSLAVWQEDLPAGNAYGLDGGWVELHLNSALGQEARLARAVPGGGAALYLKGALTDRLLQALMKEHKYACIVLENPYACLTSPETYYAYRLGGGEIRVRKRSRLLAVTVNPRGHHGFADPAALAGAVKKVVCHLPVIDVCRELTL